MKTTTKLFKSLLATAVLMLGVASSNALIFIVGTPVDTYTHGHVDWQWDGVCLGCGDTFNGTYWTFGATNVMTPEPGGMRLFLEITGQHNSHGANMVVGTVNAFFPSAGNVTGWDFTPPNNQDDYRWVWSYDDTTGTISIDGTHIPEPSTYAVLAGLLLGGFAATRRFLKR